MSGNVLTESALVCQAKATILVVEDEILTRTAASEELREHGVVMVSGQVPGPDVHGMLDGYLPKPVAPTHLASYLQTLTPARLPSEAS